MSPAGTATGAARRPRAAAAAGHLANLDGLRAVAALSILVFHVASTGGQIRLEGWQWLFNGGQIGVPVFFVLSGFLLYRPWVRSLLEGRPNPRTVGYLIKRALRILPAYWLVIACYMVTAGRAHVAEPQAWIPLLTLTHTYDPASWYDSSLGPAHLGQMWTLVVEAAWYLVLPLIAAALSWWASRAEPTLSAYCRRLLWGLAALAAISPLYSIAIFVPDRHPLLGLWLPRFFAWFALGMALAVLVVWARLEPAGTVARACRTVSASWGVCWLGAAMLFALGASPLAGPLDLLTPDAFWTSEAHIFVNGLCALALVAPVALAPPEGQPGLDAILGNRVMRFLGKISYGIFLWQMLLVVGWFRWTDRAFNGDLPIDLPVLAAATIALATVSHYLVERPFQLLAHRERKPRRPAPPS
ncbi:acyltransferase family protein [Actinomadura barringtoniae]|uniref:acyltransferase family protein n=1 Tax=Actinomadura barringtoniae TaxID=1427535 RepID=UPI001FB7E8CB|nr:acyltransferase [Actinomadura barringtoniae]